MREFRSLVRYIDGPLADRLLPHDNAFVDQIAFRKKVAPYICAVTRKMS